MGTHGFPWGLLMGAHGGFPWVVVGFRKPWAPVESLTMFSHEVPWVPVGGPYGIPWVFPWIKNLWKPMGSPTYLPLDSHKLPGFAEELSIGSPKFSHGEHPNDVLST